MGNNSPIERKRMKVKETDTTTASKLRMMKKTVKKILQLTTLNRKRDYSNLLTGPKMTQTRFWKTQRTPYILKGQMFLE